jgi:hypothetical protein
MATVQSGRLLRAIAAIGIAGAMLVTAASAGEPLDRSPGGPRGLFVVTCDFSHTNHDDPIVFPNEPGRSHEHAYFGNRSTDAASTLQSLRAAPTTCSFLGDTAAYWVPALYAGGRSIDPSGARVVYAKRTYGIVRPFPAGLKVIAGNPQARTPQSPRVTSWSCTSGRVAGPVGAPRCPSGADLVLRIDFPNCWNGKDLDSADHKRHMAYSVGLACPRTHRIPVPALQLQIAYPLGGAQPTGLASGGMVTAHADFLNGWDPALLKRWVDVYLNPRRR